MDLIIRSGTLVDGTGKPGPTGDMAVADGRTSAIGTFLHPSCMVGSDATALAPDGPLTGTGLRAGQVLRGGSCS
jgi:N-acyl-D-aspartate/D-glutamate deacylase